MNQQYENLHNYVRDLQFRFRDTVDRGDQPLAREIQGDLQRLEDEVQEGKNPHDLVEIVERIQQALLQAQHSSEQIMDPRHSVALHDEFERLRRDIRSWPGY